MERDIFRNLLPLGVNIIAGLIVYGLTQSLYSAIMFFAASLLLINIVLSIRIYSLKKSRISEVPGIEMFLPSFDQGPSLEKICEKVWSEFFFLGISAKSILSDDQFREQIVEKAKGNCEFKFLILNPASKYVEIKATEEGDTVDGWKNEIYASIMRLREIRDQHKLNIQARVFDQLPVYRIIFVNKDLLYFGWYSRGKTGKKSPLLIIHQVKNSLYEPLSGFATQLWENSHDAFDLLSKQKIYH